MISDTLKALLKFAKTERAASTPLTWKSAASVLGPLYHDDMKLQDVMYILVKSYQEALEEPRFECKKFNYVDDLLMAPIKGFSAVEWTGPKSIETMYSIEQFYNSVIKHILSELRLTRVDWLLDFTYKGL